MTQAHAASPVPAASPLLVTLRLAWRDLRAGVRGFGVFLGCLALGVMAMAAVGSVAAGLSAGLAAQGRVILGGDASFFLLQREATAPEREVLARLGPLSTVATLRAMARAPSGEAALVELKAVDQGYPAAGELKTVPQLPPAALFAPRDGVPGAVADPVLLARLGLKLGDRIEVGDGVFELRADLASEPDRLGTGVGFGPRLLVSLEALPGTGLARPGSLVRWSYRASNPLPDAALEREVEAVKAALPAGFEARTRSAVSPQLERNLGRFAQFLAVVGLVSLLVGGVGVANAVAGFVERKRATIAVLKAVGAGGGRAASIMLVQVGVLALLGVLLGVAAGAALPFALLAVFGAVIPVPLEPGPYPGPLLLAAAQGLLVALAFAVLPLGRAHDVPVSALFRDEVAPAPVRPRARYLIAALLAGAALLALAVGLAWDRRIALVTVAGAGGTFVLLRIVGWGVMAVARRLPRPRGTVGRLALANLHRPGAPTPALVLSLGLGVALVTALAVVDGTARGQIARAAPGETPSFFFVDLPNAEAERFDAFLAREAPGGTVARVPMMRGRIVALNGVPADKVRAANEAAWVLEGDRGITFAATQPEGGTLTAGAWWPEGVEGEPLVSFDAELAKGLGLAVGDTLTVNVLGREITARVANLRRVEWRSLGINFVMVFSPNSFAGAPFNDLATLTLPPGADPAGEARVLRAAAREFPGVVSVRVRDALEAVDAALAKLALAIRGASAVALATAVLVLAGALAAGRGARLREAVILKTLGASRRTLLRAYLLEYGLLGIVAAGFGTLAGVGVGAWIAAGVMKLDPIVNAAAVGGAALLAVGVTVGVGLYGSRRVLAQGVAGYLRRG